MDREVSHAVVQRLAQCGIEVIHQALPSAELFAPGPEGLLFGAQLRPRAGQLAANLCQQL